MAENADVFEAAGKANGQLTDLQLRWLAGVEMAPEANSGDAYPKYVPGHMHTAEKDLSWALARAKACGFALRVSGLVSQSMARLYGVIDDKRR